MFRLSALSVALVAAFGGNAAADEMAELTKPDTTLSIGIGDWTKRRPQTGIYDGMGDGFYSPLFEIDANRRDDATGTWIKFYAKNFGMSSVDARVEYLKQGDYGVSVDYSQITRDAPYTVRTGLQGAGTATMIVSGTGANALAKSDLQISTTREIAQFNVYKALAPSLDLQVSFRNDEKTGTRHWGMGSQPYFLVEPIDHTMRIVDLTLNYTTEKLQLSGGYNGSFFDNANPLVTARVNGVAAAGGTASAPNTTPLTTPLGNSAHQLFLNGGMNLTNTTRVTLRAAFTRAIQDEALPTYNLAAPNDRFVNAPSSLDGKIDTKLVQLGLSARPIPKLSVVASLRYQDVDDKTPLAGFVGNNGTGAITVHNTPHSIKTTVAKAEATYQLPAAVSATAGAELSKQDRSYPLFQNERYVPFRSDLDETTLKMQLRRSLADKINGSIALLHSDRDGSAYLATEHFPSDLINPIHIADRKRDKVRLSVDLAPVDRLSIQAIAESARDKYGHTNERPYGLRDGRASLLSLDANLTINDDWSVNGWVTRDRTTADIYGARWDRVTENYELDRTYNLKDIGDSVGLGARGKVTSKIRVGGDLQWTRNTSEYHDKLDTAGPGDALSPPVAAGGTTARTTVALADVETKTIRLALFAQYAIEKRSDIRFDYVYEQFKTNDWTWLNGAGTAFTYGGTGGTDGTTVLTVPRQTSSYLGARYIHRFQ
jgi:MtrB/PioB family decaheme-associated outer membrane protein